MEVLDELKEVYQLNKEETQVKKVANLKKETENAKGIKKGDITENQIRKEQGLNKRGAY